MTSISQHSFLQATKGKIILGFLLAFFVLLMIWGLNNIAFNKILNTVESISAPNQRLKIVTQLSHQLVSLDQIQKNKALKNPGNYFYKETKSLKSSLDTLKTLYANDSSQLARIYSIQKLLAIRDKQFVEYLKVREGLISNKSFSDQVDKLNEMVGSRLRGADSAILTTKTTTSKTTVAPKPDDQSKGFLSRLFGKKKAEVYQIINEEFQIKRDTLSGITEDSIIRSVSNSIQAITAEHQLKSKRFLKRETVLAEANAKLTGEIFGILKQVENEAVKQINKDGLQATEFVNKEIKQIGYILLFFFIFTGALLYFILTDISKSNRYRKELELAKEEAEYYGKTKQRFLSNMSHEIRTPLQSILGYSELVRRQETPEKKDLDAIYQSSVHLLQIVNEVLDYSRIVSGEFTLNKINFNISILLNEVVSAMQPLAKHKSILLLKDFDLEENCMVIGDAFRLKQILYNLLGNAIKFTLKGEVKLSVSYKEQGENCYFSFTVQDTGVGFDEKHVERIFKEFEQVDFPEKVAINQSGTGLGLSIVNSLLQLQNGRINVKSKKGEGTTFNFQLTYQKGAVLSGEYVDQIVPVVSVLGKVWMIDDDRLILDLCEMIFKEHHLDYRTFNNATEVLDADLDDEVKYVLIDMRLPEISGDELCRILKEKMADDVKFYAITAQVLPDERESVLSAGFDGLILKPFRTEDLLSIFERKEAVTIEQEDVPFDPSVIEKMTFGNQELLRKIMLRFKQDCKADAHELEQLMVENDQPKCRLIAHRLAGRIAQIGAKTLAFDFRELELSISEQPLLTDTQIVQIKLLLSKLRNLMAQLDSRIYEMP